MDTAERFTQRHGGYRSLERFIGACQDDLPLAQIAQMFNLSVAQVCRLRAHIMQRRWIPRQATIDYVEFRAHIEERQAAEKHETAKSYLRLIQGGGKWALSHSL